MSCFINTSTLFKNTTGQSANTLIFDWLMFGFKVSFVSSLYLAPSKSWLSKSSYIIVPGGSGSSMKNWAAELNRDIVFRHKFVFSIIHQ